MTKMKLMIVDEFYPDPWSVRRYALSLRFQDAATEDEKTYYKGMLTSPHHPYAALGLNLLTTGLNRPLSWRAPTGEFRLILAPEPNDGSEQKATWIHYDALVASYSALVFLNPDRQCVGGTNFYRHRTFGWEFLPDPGSQEMARTCGKLGRDVQEVLNTLRDDGFALEDKWDLLASVPMRFNRCIVFDSRQFHARTGTFGRTAQDGRLTQNFFFDLA